MEQQKIITITLEEYKELLIIKGKYEELKEIQKPIIMIDDKGLKEPYKITC